MSLCAGLTGVAVCPFLPVGDCSSPLLAARGLHGAVVWVTLGFAADSLEVGKMSLGDWLGIAGLAVSAVGFAVTIWQLVRTARAASAARQAVERTERRMAINHLLVLLPQFRLLEADLDRAAQENDRALARTALVSYSHFASEVASLLKGQQQVDSAIILELEISAREASVAKSSLIDAPGSKTTKLLTKDVRDRMSTLSLHIGVLSTSYQATTLTEGGSK
jgi:hypothetical protein